MCGVVHLMRADLEHNYYKATQNKFCLNLSGTLPDYLYQLDVIFFLTTSYKEEQCSKVQRS